MTGASGFIGARLCQWLTARGHTAVAIGRRTAPDISAVCDLHDRASLRTVLTGADAVVHAAAVVPGRHGGAEVADNVTLAEAVARAAGDARVPVRLLLSSTSVYGDLPVVNATTQPRPDSIYGESKLAAEAAFSWAPAGCAACVRVPLVYAAGMRGFYGRLVDLARAGWPLPLARLDAPRTCIGRDNLCALLLHCIELAVAAPGSLPSPVLCGDAELGLTDLLRAAAPDARLFAGPDWLLGRVADLAGRGRDWRRLVRGQHIDHVATDRALGWVAPLDAATGLRELSAGSAVDVRRLVDRSPG